MAVSRSETRKTYPRPTAPLHRTARREDHGGGRREPLTRRPFGPPTSPRFAGRGEDTFMLGLWNRRVQALARAGVKQSEQPALAKSCPYLRSSPRPAMRGESGRGAAAPRSMKSVLTSPREAGRGRRVCAPGEGLPRSNRIDLTREIRICLREISLKRGSPSLVGPAGRRPRPARAGRGEEAFHASGCGSPRGSGRGPALKESVAVLAPAAP
jgi:hypothetical protein